MPGLISILTRENPIPRAQPSGSNVGTAASAVFPRAASFATGWMMTLADFIVCPREAVAVSRIAGYILPGLDTMIMRTFSDLIQESPA
jgi:L-asparagine transporter-like permease